MVEMELEVQKGIKCFKRENAFSFFRNKLKVWTSFYVVMMIVVESIFIGESWEVRSGIKWLFYVWSYCLLKRTKSWGICIQNLKFLIFEVFLYGRTSRSFLIMMKNICQEGAVWLKTGWKFNVMINWNMDQKIETKSGIRPT
jgi:hypothetical protein